MTFFRASFGIITRTPKAQRNGKMGKPGSALRRSAYQRCVNEGPYRFARKAHELVSHGIIQPAGSRAYASPKALWGAAEAMEKRVDSQLARTLEIAIPHAVPMHLRDQFAHHMLGWLAKDHGFAVEWSRHAANHLLNDGTGTLNDHIHGQVSLRQLGPEGFSAKKDREFNTIMRKRNGREMRESIAERMNQFFERHDIAAKVTADPKSDDAFRIEEAPKAIIQQIRRHQNARNNQLPAPKLGPRAKDFIRARHAQKNAIAAVAAASRETSVSQGNSNPTDEGVAATARPTQRTNSGAENSSVSASAVAGTDPRGDTGRPTSRTAGSVNAEDRGLDGKDRFAYHLGREQRERIARNLAANRRVIRRGRKLHASAAISGFKDALTTIASVGAYPFKAAVRGLTAAIRAVAPAAPRM